MTSQPLSSQDQCYNHNLCLKITDFFPWSWFLIWMSIGKSPMRFCMAEHWDAADVLPLWQISALFPSFLPLMLLDHPVLHLLHQCLFYTSPSSIPASLSRSAWGESGAQHGAESAQVRDLLLLHGLLSGWWWKSCKLCMVSVSFSSWRDQTPKTTHKLLQG